VCGGWKYVKGDVGAARPFANFCVLQGMCERVALLERYPWNGRKRDSSLSLDAQQYIPRNSVSGRFFLLGRGNPPTGFHACPGRKESIPASKRGCILAFLWERGSACF
jgi:hypothetical protein